MVPPNGPPDALGSSDPAGRAAPLAYERPAPPRSIASNLLGGALQGLRDLWRLRSIFLLAAGVMLAVVAALAALGFALGWHNASFKLK